MHTITSLFQQLGLDSSNEAIANFVSKNGQVPKGVRLFDAQIWTESQAAFLKQAIEEDADWAEVVDQLNVMLR